MSDPMDTHEGLLACPFCGSASVDYIGAPGKGYRVECKGCLAQSSWGDYGYQVKANWNARAGDAQAVGRGLADDVLSVLYTYRDHQPEEGESWESWYYAAFDLACMKIRELFNKPVAPSALPSTNQPAPAPHAEVREQIAEVREMERHEAALALPQSERGEVGETEQHIAWLRQYLTGMTSDNWCDMKLRAERQLDSLASALSRPNQAPVETTGE